MRSARTCGVHATRYTLIGGKMNHLYKTEDGLIHKCNSTQLFSNDKDSIIVWTKCDIDVPANKSFKSNEIVTCPECLRV